MHRHHRQIWTSDFSPGQCRALSVSPSDEELGSTLAARTAFRRLVHVASCASTQDLAAADRGSDAAVFWADHQTAGRGRQQRPWRDDPGQDLAVTFRVRPALPLPVALPVVVPLCVLDALEPHASGRLRLEWPNDVLLDDRKVAGVLIDADSAQPGQFLVGVGINVNGRPAAELASTATSLRLATGRAVDRAALLLALACGLDLALEALARGDRAPVEQRFAHHLGLLGRRVVVRAGELISGELAGLDFDGLRLHGGRTIPLGQVQELRAE
jgi:BirA family biotin operon repressor/biotin-[acetyl-CoA-carboxylase] ligase